MYQNYPLALFEIIIWINIQFEKKSNLIQKKKNCFAICLQCLK